MITDVICVLFLLSSQPILSSVSVEFDFNASLNDVAPVPPISLPVDLIRMEEWTVDGCHSYVAYEALTIQIKFG